MPSGVRCQNIKQISHESLENLQNDEINIQKWRECVTIYSLTFSNLENLQIRISEF